MARWQRIPLDYLQCSEKKCLVYMNMDYNKVDQYLPNIPKFYKYVLKSWMKLGG